MKENFKIGDYVVYKIQGLTWSNWICEVIDLSGPNPHMLHLGDNSGYPYSSITTASSENFVKLSDSDKKEIDKKLSILKDAEKEHEEIENQIRKLKINLRATAEKVDRVRLDVLKYKNNNQVVAYKPYRENVKNWD